MCNQIERKLIDNVNRLTVGALASSGFLMDGIQMWDLPYGLSLALWLALPECGNTIEKLIDKMKPHQPTTAVMQTKH